MSVINKMLQDLEQRQQPTASRVATGQPPAATASTNRVYLWVLIAVIVLVTSGWWLLSNSNNNTDSNTKFKMQAVTVLPAPVPDTAMRQAATNDAVMSAQPGSQPPIDNETVTAEPVEILAALASEPAAAAAPVQPTVIRAAAPKTSPTPVPVTPIKPQATVDKQPLSAEQLKHNMRLRANASEAAGDTSASIVIWQQLLADQPTEADSYLNLARLWLKQQQVVTASQVLLQAQQNGVVSTEINLQLAQLAISQGQWQQALQFLPDQFELTAQPEYYGFKATVLQQLQQFGAALELYQQLHQLQPEQGRWSLGAALTSEQAGQPQQAHQYYQRAWQQRQALSLSSHDFIQQRLKATEP